MLAILEKTMCIVNHKYKKPYKIWKHKLYSLESIVYILSVFYSGKVKDFKKGSKIIFATF